jgi:hypothetical protein
MSKQYGEYDNCGLARGHILGFFIHVFGLAVFVASFISVTGPKFFGLWEISAIGALFLMLASIFVIIGGVMWAGIFPIYRSWNNGKFVWYDPVKKERYTTEEYMGPNW